MIWRARPPLKLWQVGNCATRFLLLFERFYWSISPFVTDLEDLGEYTTMVGGQLYRNRVFGGCARIRHERHDDVVETRGGPYLGQFRQLDEHFQGRWGRGLRHGIMSVAVADCVIGQIPSQNIHQRRAKIQVKPAIVAMDLVELEDGERGGALHGLLGGVLHGLLPHHLHQRRDRAFLHQDIVQELLRETWQHHRGWDLGPVRRIGLRSRGGIVAFCSRQRCRMHKW